MKRPSHTHTASVILAVSLAAAVAGLAAGCSSGSDDVTSTVATDSVDTTVASAPLDDLSVQSTIFGEADTSNKSTLKKVVQKTSGPGDIDVYYTNDQGERVAYKEGAVVDGDQLEYTGEAILKINVEGVDDSKIDSSNAVVSLVEGDGYYVDELILKATTLDGEWQNGEISYALETGDLDWDPGDYDYIDDNSGREWSCFGGDGNGCYTFNFQVSGVEYDAEPLNDATFEVKVYIWGRNASDMAARSNTIREIEATPGSSGTQPGSSVEYVVVGESDIPDLSDNNADDFFIVWPEGTDASSLDPGAVTVTLKGANDELVLREGTDYTVFADEAETQVAVTYRHWATAPLYSELTIEADGDGPLQASNTWDITSACIYQVQQGGGGLPNDGYVTVLSFYGIEPIEDLADVANTPLYRLEVEQDGQTLYYAEDDAGIGSLVEDQKEAQTYDASGPDEMDVALLGPNSVVYKTREGDHLMTTRTVDGDDITFTKSYDRLVVDISGALKNGTVTTLPGVTPQLTVATFWAWLDRFGYGWTADKYSGAPTSFPYPDPAYL